MGYSVAVSGRVRLEVGREAEAFAVLKGLVWRSEDLDGSVEGFSDLAALFGAAVVREGDWVLFQPDVDGDPKWSDRATAFFSALSQWATAGEVQVAGEDGAEWSYVYGGGGVTQIGINGYDGSATAVERRTAPRTTVVGMSAAGTDSLPPEVLDVSPRSASDEPPPRLRSNVATLCCANPRPELFGHPAPWTSEISAWRQLRRAGDAPNDVHDLSYVVSLLASDRRSTAELGELVDQLADGYNSVDSAQLVHRLRQTQMVVAVMTESTSFTPDQLGRIHQLQPELDAVLIHEEVLTYRAGAGAEPTATVRL
jgi:hypothetical protein